MKMPPRLLPLVEDGFVDEVVPAATLTYFLNKNFSLELLCCFAKHDVNLKAPPAFAALTGNIGETWIFPPAVTLQYHFDGLGPFKPYDANTRKIVDSLHRSNCAIECKGAAFCERHNRTLACRAFPFFPFIDRKGAFIGLSYYWDFEDRCWVISNMQIVEAEFLKEFVDAFEYLFSIDPEEFDTYKSHSANMRRVFSRRGQPIPLIGREGGFFKVMPKTGKLLPMTAAQLPKYGPYKSPRAYARAVKEAQATQPDDQREVTFAAE